MDDKQILDLYWERSEAAISETSKKYGKYCRYIAFNILHNATTASQIPLRSSNNGRIKINAT